MIARIARRTWAVLGSQGLAVVLLLLLFLLTWMGTLAQQSDNLYNVQRRFFESWFLVADVGGLPVPMPGAMLVLGLLFINLLVGGLVRLRWAVRRVGIALTHIGIAMLILSGFIELQTSTKGYLSLHEAEPFEDLNGDGVHSQGERFQDWDGNGRWSAGQTGSHYVSYYEWDLLLAEARPGERPQWVVPYERLEDLGSSGRVRHQHADLPFTLEVRGWLPNARVRRVQPGEDFGVDGLVLERLREHPEKKEANLPGLYVGIAPKDGSAPFQAIATADALYPYVFSAGGRKWQLDLTRRTWQFPFVVRLDRFVHREHPGTRRPLEFSSHITKIENDIREERHITMNEPLRHRGYTLYQSSFGEEETRAGPRRLSVFAVVKNPADILPFLAWLVIAIGLAWHFGLRLFAHIGSERRKAAARTAGAAPTPAVLGLLLGLACLLPSTRLAHAEDATPATPAHTAAQPPAATLPTWPESMREAAATIAVQDGGRIKPLSTYARFTLLSLYGRSSYVPTDGTADSPDARDALSFLLDAWFFPDVLAQQRLFLIEDDQVLETLGLAFEDRKKRDRYSYAELAPGRQRLQTRKGEILKHLEDLRARTGKVKSDSLTAAQREVDTLYGRVVAFESLVATARPLRGRFTASPAVAAVVGWQAGDEVSPIQVADAMPSLMMSAVRDVVGSGQSGEDGANSSAGASALRTELTTLVEALDTAASQVDAVAMIPPPRPADRDAAWFGISRALRSGSRGGALDPRTWPADQSLAIEFAQHRRQVLEVLGKFEAAIGFRLDATARAREFTDFARGLGSLARARGGVDHIEAEVAFYKTAPFMKALLAYVFAFILLAATWLWGRARFLYGAALVVMGIGFALHVYGVVVRCVIQKRPPVATLYETILFISGVAVLAAFAIEWINRKRIAIVLVPVLGAAGLFLAQRYEAFRGEDTMNALEAVLNTNFWLATHVVTVTMGYAAGLLAAGIGHITLLGRIFSFRKDDSEFYRTLQRMTYGTICFGLFFSVIGTILGGIWANDSWGRFWGWDPKENGALMICLWMIAILHARMAGWLRGHGLAMAAVATGPIVAWSWWGVNLLEIGLHSYGFTAGVNNKLNMYYAIEVAVLVAGFVWWLQMRSAGRPTVVS